MIACDPHNLGGELPLDIKKRYIKVFFYLGLIMHKISLDKFTRFIKISDFKESPFSFQDYSFFKTYTKKKEKKFIGFYRFVTKFLHPKTVSEIFKKVTFKHFKNYLKKYRHDEEGILDKNKKEKKWFSRKELISLISRFSKECKPLFENYEEQMKEALPQWLVRKIAAQEKSEVKKKEEYQHPQPNLERFLDIVVKPVHNCLIEEYDEGKNCPFPEMKTDFRKILKMAVNLPKYAPFRDKRRVSFTQPGNLTNGLLTFYTSKILYYSVKMEKSLSIAKRNGSISKWKYIFPRVSSQYNQWEARKQIFPGKFIRIRKHGAEFKNLVAILCFKDDDNFYQWGSKVRLDSIRIFNLKTKRVVKTIEVHHFFNDEWYYGSCKFSIDFNFMGHLFFRIFHRDGYHVLNLSEPKKHTMKSKPYRLFEISKFESQPFTYKDIISSSGSERRFSIHLKKKNKDFVYIYKPRITGDLPRGSSICLDPSDLRQRLLAHYLLFDSLVLLIFREEMHLLDYKNGKRIIYQLEQIRNFFKDRKGFKNLKREFCFDVKFKKIYFRIGYRYQGSIDLSEVFCDVFERYPFYEQKGKYL